MSLVIPSILTSTTSTIWTKIKAFYGNHKGKVIFAIALVIALLAAFFLGRHLTPSKVVTVTKTVEKTVDHVVYKDRVVTKVVYVKDKKQHEHIVTVVVQKPDGEKTTTTTEDENSDTEVSKNTNKDQSVSKNETKTNNIETNSKTVLTYKQPSWMIGEIGRA